MRPCALNVELYSLGMEPCLTVEHAYSLNTYKYHRALLRCILEKKGGVFLILIIPLISDAIRQLNRSPDGWDIRDVERVDTSAGHHLDRIHDQL